MGNATCCAVKNGYRNQEQVIQPIVDTNSKGMNSNRELKLNIKRKEDQFDYKLLSTINRVRTAPNNYCEGLKNIRKECELIDNRTVYRTPQQKKLILSGGLETIDNAIEFLRNTPPMKELTMSEDLKVDFFQRDDLLKCTEDDIAKYLEKKIKELKLKYSQVNVIVNYFEDTELCIFLNIIEPNFQCYKRQIILNPQLTLYGTSYCKLKDRMFTSISMFANY